MKKLKTKLLATSKGAEKYNNKVDLILCKFYIK